MFSLPPSTPGHRARWNEWRDMCQFWVERDTLAISLCTSPNKEKKMWMGSKNPQIAWRQWTDPHQNHERLLHQYSIYHWIKVITLDHNFPLLLLGMILHVPLVNLPLESRSKFDCCDLLEHNTHDFFLSECWYYSSITMLEEEIPLCRSYWSTLLSFIFPKSKVVIASPSLQYQWS